MALHLLHPLMKPGKPCWEQGPATAFLLLPQAWAPLHHHPALHTISEIFPPSSYSLHGGEGGEKNQYNLGKYKPNLVLKFTF